MILLKPKDMKRRKRSKVTKDGRLIESRYQYAATKVRMWDKQKGMCGNCGAYMPFPVEAHRHHPGGRGLGGSKRDDSKTVLWCEKCHVEEHERLRH